MARARKQRLQLQRRRTVRQARLDALLRDRIWPSVPANVLGKSVSKKQRERILGYGPEGF